MTEREQKPRVLSMQLLWNSLDAAQMVFPDKGFGNQVAAEEHEKPSNAKSLLWRQKIPKLSVAVSVAPSQSVLWRGGKGADLGA